MIKFVARCRLTAQTHSFVAADEFLTEMSEGGDS
jgi:hypothetical protein